MTRFKDKLAQKYLALFCIYIISALQSIDLAVSVSWEDDGNSVVYMKMEHKLRYVIAFSIFFWGKDIPVWLVEFFLFINICNDLSFK